MGHFRACHPGNRGGYFLEGKIPWLFQTNLAVSQRLLILWMVSKRRAAAQRWGEGLWETTGMWVLSEACLPGDLDICLLLSLESVYSIAWHLQTLGHGY